MYRHSVLKKEDNNENLSHCCIYIWKAKIMKNTCITFAVIVFICFYLRDMFV